MTCEEYRNIVEANEEVTEEIADQMDEHDFQCDECEQFFNDMFIEILSVDPDMSTDDLLGMGKSEEWIM